LPRKTDSNNPADWLFIAQGELEAVQFLAAQEVGHIVCRAKLAEVIEKLLKAELIRQGWFLVKTHDLVRLNDDLRQCDAQLANRFESLVEELSDAYLTDRYPGFDIDDPDWPLLRQQIQQVADVLAQVKARVQ